MKTIQLTSPDSNQVQVSAMGATEGARRATGDAPMAGAVVIRSFPRHRTQRFLKKSRAVILQPNTSFEFWLKLMPAHNRANWEPCCVVKDFIHRA